MLTQALDSCVAKVPTICIVSASINNLLLQVFLKGPSLYAFKGLAGRFAPIGVHLALLLIMGGATISAAGSFRGSVTVPQGLNFVVGDVMGPSGFLSTPSEAFSTEVHVNRFYMDYYDSGEVNLLISKMIATLILIYFPFKPFFPCLNLFFFVSRFPNFTLIFHYLISMGKR